jgi:23S rRNA pseudouridine1911/1915/1917 synthase
MDSAGGFPEELIDETAVVSPTCVGRRFDQVAAELFADYSRSRLQQWIKRGQLVIDGQ